MTMQPSAASLYYFHGRGNSQQARWALAAAKIPWKNVCLSSKAEFEELCASGKLTYAQVPMLEQDGCCISQSMAIVRHAARVGALYGADHEQAARIDEVLEGIRDMRGPIVGYPFTDATEACQRLQSSMKRFLPHLERLITRNASPPFIVGPSLTIADILLGEVVHSSLEAFSATYREGDVFAAKVLEPYPKCMALHDHVVALPEIREFMTGPNWFTFPAGQVGREYVHNVQTVLRG